jgi:hypothetical protein
MIRISPRISALTLLSGINLMLENHSSKNYCYRKNFAGSGYLCNQKGIALVAGLTLMTVLSLLIITAIQYATQDITRTKNYTETLQATHIAEAGIHRALGYFNYDSVGDSPGEASNGFDDELDDSNWPASTFTSIGIGSGGGTYSVVIDDNADGDSDTNADVDKNVILTSTGTIDGVTATVEAYIYRPQFKSKFALLSEGDIDVNGNSTNILGGNGAVHSNGDVTQTGNPTVEQGATATGSCGGSNCNAGAEEEFVPVLEPSDYEQYADYIFNDDGTIDQNVSGTITTGVEGNAIFSKFSHNTQGWSVGNSAVVGTSVPNQAFLYFKDDFKAASIGSAGTPWEITIVTEKSIAWTGSANITNWAGDSDHTPDIQNLFLVAENDIKISGLDQDTEGLIACKDQFSISGGANLTGYIIGNNLTTSDNVVNGSESGVAGGMTITYAGDLLAPVLDNKVTILSWQKT